jgi:hypothetical protein
MFLVFSLARIEIMINLSTARIFFWAGSMVLLNTTVF